MVEGRALMRQTRISILLSNFASYACLRHSTQLPIYLISPCCCSLSQTVNGTLSPAGCSVPVKPRCVSMGELTVCSCSKNLGNLILDGGMANFDSRLSWTLFGYASLGRYAIAMLMEEVVLYSCRPERHYGDDMCSIQRVMLSMQFFSHVSSQATWRLRWPVTRGLQMNRECCQCIIPC